MSGITQVYLHYNKGGIGRGKKALREFAVYKFRLLNIRSVPWYNKKWTETFH